MHYYLKWNCQSLNHESGIKMNDVSSQYVLLVVLSMHFFLR